MNVKIRIVFNFRTFQLLKQFSYQNIPIMIARCDYFDSGYTCHVSFLTIVSPGLDVSIGSHHRNTCVNCLKIAYQCMSYFPRNLAAVFPNLTEIKIKDCGLKEISKNNLAGFEKLKVLCLKNNQLTSLPDDLFQNNKRVQAIDFDGNQLRDLSSRLLHPILRTIQFVSFRNNPGIDVRFNEGERDFQRIDELVASVVETAGEKA